MRFIVTNSTRISNLPGAAVAIERNRSNSCSWLFPMTANGASVPNGRIVPAIPVLAGSQSKARKRAGASWPFSSARRLSIPKGPFLPSEFVPTKFSSAQDKADFGNTFLHFIESEWARTCFSKSFYNRLSMCFGNIARHEGKSFKRN